MECIAFEVTRREDESVRLGVAEPAALQLAEPVFASVPALERALRRVGLPEELALGRGRSAPVAVSFVQLSRLGFL